MTYLSSFILGFAVMCVEVIGFRVLQFHVGSSSIVTGTILSIILGALMIGNFVGGIVVRKEKYLSIFHYQLLFISLYFFITHTFIINEFLNSNYILSLSNVFYKASLICFIFYFPPCFVLGQNLPVLIKKNSAVHSDHGVNASKILTISSIGSLLGTLSTSIILLPSIGQSNCVTLISLILLALSVHGLLKKKYKKLSLLVLPFIFFVTNSTPTLIDGNTISKESIFNKIKITNTEDYLFLKTSQATDVFIDKKNYLANIWSLTNIIPGIIYSPSTALILGLSGGINALQLKELNPDIELSGVELDREITTTVDNLLSGQLSKYVKFYFDDARNFLRQNKEKFDFIVIDIFLKTSVPEHCITKEFFVSIKEHLTSNGYVSINTNMIDTFFEITDEGKKYQTLRRLQSTLFAAGFNYQLHNTLTNNIYLFNSQEMYNSFFKILNKKILNDQYKTEVTNTLIATSLKSIFVSKITDNGNPFIDDKSPSHYLNNLLKHSFFKNFISKKSSENIFIERSKQLYLKNLGSHRYDPEDYIDYISSIKNSPTREELAKYFDFNIRKSYTDSNYEFYLYNYNNFLNYYRKSMHKEAKKEFQALLTKRPDLFNL